MRIAVCLDDRLGMLFNRRRQSRDRVVIADLIGSLGDARLRIAPFSERLFEGVERELLVSEDFLESAEGDDVCFVEDRSLGAVADRIDVLTVYRWNRHYPADFYFDLDLQASGFRLCERVELAGYSHETITKETYTK